MPTDAALSTALPAQPPLRNVIVAATIGNVLEWFDFLVYGYFAVVIAEVFFPAGNPTISLLVTLALLACHMSYARLAQSSSVPIPTALAAKLA